MDPLEVAVTSTDHPLSGMTPVVHRSAAAQVADQLVLGIREGRVLDRLPTEREMAERFGVSRPTIREALAALELAGLVRSQRGSGTVVIATPAQVATWGLEIIPPQVFEARIAIEPHLAALAATKRYPEDIEELRQVLTVLEEEFAATHAYQSDLAMHRAIARAARNPLLQEALEDALRHQNTDLWTELRARALTQEDNRASHVAESRAVVDHIARGEADQAAEVWRSHLLRYRDEMLGRGETQ
ncbi:FadR/GntR family transcriptional regulator [Kribbella sp. NPDC059898]|uniref:FadR/GntR family transcriptional regulator n=1 Tax=Kribbella sp. NPDC059898 TaxID=3346995 RepID=UPI003659233C